MDIKRAGIFSNKEKDPELAGAKAVAQALRRRGVEVLFGGNAMPDGEEVGIDYESIDCLFVLGGDGTLLKAANNACRSGVSILGINLGRLGFLTETELQYFDQALDNIESGKFFVEKRMMLHCEVYSGGEATFKFDALNDVAVMKKEIARTIRIKLLVNGTLADDVYCDGMLVSTPTGSTGYSLSAGGPVVDPKIECMLATPVCPHSLHSRTLVVSADDEILIEPFTPAGISIVSDGAIQMDANDKDTIRIIKSRHLARFIRFKGDYFYPLLRSKFLNWDR